MFPYIHLVPDRLGSRVHEEGRRTFVFCIMRCRGDNMRATREVEKSISMMAMFPSSLLKILENGSVWYMRKPLEVPEAVSQTARPRSYIPVRGVGNGEELHTDSETAVVLVEGDEVQGCAGHGGRTQQGVSAPRCPYISFIFLAISRFVAEKRARRFTDSCRETLRVGDRNQAGTAPLVSSLDQIKSHRRVTRTS